jgi:hypothetical protein
MKENWMNKLIELLNEYDDWMVSWYEEYFPTEWLFVTNAGQWFREEFILGKRYWFIKWLLDNDKIDLLKLDNRIALSEFNKVERVLMALSIQDNPIEFLISILK